MRTKKVIAMLIALVMMMSLAIIPASADAAFTITAQNATVKLGQNVTVKIDAAFAASGGIGFEITYNTADLTFVSGAPAEGAPFKASDLLVEEAESGKITVGIVADMLPEDENDPDYPFSGTILDLVFKAKDSMEVAKTTSEIVFAFVSESTLDGEYNAVAEADMAFNKGTVSIVKTHEAPVVTTTITGDAVVGKTLTASATFTDNWNLTATPTYEWFIDGASVGTGETYEVKLADYGKTITAKATVTVAADENPTGVDEATTAAVIYNAEAKGTLTNVSLPETVAVGAPVEVSYDFEPSVNGGTATVVSVEWSDKGGKELKGTKEGNTYTPSLEDFNNGVILVAKITVKGTNDTATVDATATAASAVVAGNMAPVVTDVIIEVNNEDDKAPESTPYPSAAVVGDVLTAWYTWSDIAAVGGPDQSTTDASTIQWYANDVAIEGATEKTYTVTPAEIGKAITVKVTPISTDDTENTNLGADYDEVNGKVEASKNTIAAAKNEKAPVVENVEFTSSAVKANTNVKVTWDFSDENAFDDNSTFKILVADEDTTEAWAEAVEFATGTVADKDTTQYKFDASYIGKFAKIVVTPVNSDTDADKTAGTDAESEVYKIAKKSSGSAGLTGPNLASPSTGTGSGTGSVVVPTDNRIILTINSKTAIVAGKEVENDVAPIIVNDRTMLPARFVAEQLGATVAWDAENYVVTITKGDITIVITIDSDKALVNGEEVTLDSPAFIQNDRTYTPIRFVSEALGATVEWDEAAQKVTITPAE